jgi:lincosamide nucleotidyltransferase A/C/D/E
MEAEDVVTLLNALEQERIGVVVDGGWGVDALLGHQTRQHDDLDIAIENKHVVKLRRLLETKGFREIPHPNSSDFNFVLAAGIGQKVDVHSYTLNSDGRCIYGIPYPAESLTGTGSIGSRIVKCISPEWVVKFHTRYEPDENDFRDVHAVCARFGIAIPPKYVR